MSLDPVAKTLIIAGIVFLILGGLWQMGWLQALRLGRLPGDIAIERENMRFYFPITSAVLVSLVLSLLAWIFRR